MWWRCRTRAPLCTKFSTKFTDVVGQARPQGHVNRKLRFERLGPRPGPAAVTQNHETLSRVVAGTGVIVSFKCPSVFLLHQTRSTGADHSGLQ